MQNVVTTQTISPSQEEITLLDLWRYVANYMTNIKGRSPKTVTGYKYLWSRLVKRLGNILVSRLTLTMLDEHPAWLRANSDVQLKDITVFRNMMGIKQVIRYGHMVLERMDRHDLDRVKAEAVECGRTSQNDDTSFLTLDEVKKLYRSTENAHTVWQLRDAAIIRCLISTGCRATEFVLLRWDDITFSPDNQMAVVKIRAENAKRRKAREVLLNKEAARALLAYRALLPTERAEVWISERCKRNGSRVLERNALQRIITSAVLKAGIISLRPERTNLDRNRIKKEDCLGNWVSPHSFRRTCATIMYIHRAGLVDIQHYLGHSTILTTQRYVKPILCDKAQLAMCTLVLEENVATSAPQATSTSAPTSSPTKAPQTPESSTTPVTAPALSLTVAPVPMPEPPTASVAPLLLLAKNP